MDKGKHPIKFTLLCACKNEEQDIHLALESSVIQTYPNKEIIFVDDSTDRTKEIIRSYSNKGVILLDGPGHGCCQARNLAMQKATGDVIVFLTADTDLEPGYLEKIAPYYEQGYDYVMVESYSNLDTVYSRFVQVEHLITANSPGYNPLTTQGYSVRRSAALDVGGISGGDYPVNFCRDWSLLKKMQEKGYEGKIDRSIIVPHKSADNFNEYWRIQKTRGLWSAYQPYFLFFRSPTYLFFKFIAKSALTFLEFVLILPAAWHVFKMAKNSPNPVRDFFPFFYAYFLHMLAYRVGEWKGWLYITSYNRVSKPPLLGVIRYISKVVRQIPQIPFRGRDRIINFLFKNPIKTSIKYEGYTIPIDTGTYFVEKEIYFKGYYEKDMVDLIKKNLPKGGVFVDIGANIGCHTLIASRIASKVIAIEPIPVIRERLLKTLKDNNINNVVVLDYALSDEEGTATFACATNTGSLVPEAIGKYKTQDITVKKTTLDSLLKDEPRIDFIKIDCEGHDREVLYGGKEVIKKFKPIVVFKNQLNQHISIF